MGFISQIRTEGARFAAQFRDSLILLPWLSVAIGCYWAMIVLSLYSPYLLGNMESSAMPISASAISTVASIVAYIVVSIKFRACRMINSRRWFLPALGAFMTIGAFSYVLALSGLLSSDFSAFLFCVGLTVVGVTTAGICFALALVFAAIGPRRVLFHGSIALFGGSIAVFFVSLLPHFVASVVFVLLPSFLAGSLARSFQRLTSRQRSSYDVDQAIHIPWKFLVTSALQGIALGVMHSALIAAPASLAQFSTLGFCGAALLLMITALIALQDFNTLFYRVSFPMMALGFFFVWLGVGPSNGLLVGGVVLDAGYCYQYLVSCCLCAYLARNFNQSPYWIVGISTACLLGGQLCGSIAAMFVNSTPMSSSLCVFLLLSSSLYLTSDKNLKFGWGSFRPGEYCNERRSATQNACELVASESGLSKRETEVMQLMAAGATRKEIAETLVLSEETVKSHASNLYQKLGIHSKKELANLVESRVSLFE